MAATVPSVITPRDLNDGAIRPYITDTPDSLQLGASVDLAGINSFEWELDGQEDETYGDGEVLDYYSSLQKVAGSVGQAQMGLAALAELIGGNLVAGAGYHEVDLSKSSNVPVVQLLVLTNYLGDGQYGEFLQTFHRVRIGKLKYALKTGYAEVSFDFTGWGQKFLFNSQHRLVSLSVNGGSSSSIADSVDYTDRRLILPVWKPDSSTGTWNQATGSQYLRYRVFYSSTLTHSLTWTRVLGVGVHTLTVYCYKFTTAGILTVSIDGVAVGTLDLYAASPSNTSVSLAFLITAPGSHSVKLEITDKNGSSSGYAAYLSDLVVTGPDYSRLNTLPRLDQLVAEIRPSEYTDNDGTVTIATPAGAYPEQIEQTALGDWVEFTAWVGPGTYSLKAFLGKTSDGGQTTFYVDDSIVGTAFDGYNASTVAPASQTIGTFAVTHRKLVTIKALTTGKHGSSSGYRRSISWVQLVRIVAGDGGLDGDIAQRTVVLQPWNSDGNTNFSTQAYNASQLLTYWLRSSSGAQNAEIYWDGIRLEAGTYHLVMVAAKGSANGKAHFLFDSDDLAQVDLYAASATYNQILTATLTITETKSARFSVKMADKHASASAYTGQFSYLTLKKVA